MKIDNIKEEVTHDLHNLREKMKQKYKRKWKATPEDKQNRISEHDDEMEIE
jgi:hypothetical protein